MKSRTRAVLVGFTYAALSVACYGRGLHQEFAGPAILLGPPLSIAWRFEMVAVYLVGTGLLVTLALAARAAPRWKPRLIPVGIGGWIICGLVAVAPSI